MLQVLAKKHWKYNAKLKITTWEVQSQNIWIEPTAVSKKFKLNNEPSDRLDFINSVILLGLLYNKHHHLSKNIFSLRALSDWLNNHTEKLSNDMVLHFFNFLPCIERDHKILKNHPGWYIMWEYWLFPLFK